jgi:hypothetical protein
VAGAISDPHKARAYKAWKKLTAAIAPQDS